MVIVKIKLHSLHFKTFIKTAFRRKSESNFSEQLKCTCLVSINQSNIWCGVPARLAVFLAHYLNVKFLNLELCGKIKSKIQCRLVTTCLLSNSMSIYEERVIIHISLESLVEPRLFLSPNIIISVIAFLVFVSIIYPLIRVAQSAVAQ